MFIITFGNKLLTQISPHTNFETWHLRVSGEKCQHKKCSLRVNHSIFDNCCISPSTPEMTSSDQKVQQFDIRTQQAFRPDSHSISPVTVYSVIIAVTVLELLLLFYFGCSYKQKKKNQL